MSIAHLKVMSGDAPPGMVRRVLAWAKRHQKELALCWTRCRSGVRPGGIET